MEEAQAQQVAHMLEQRSSLKSSMDAMDLQKTAAQTAANGAAKVAAVRFDALFMLFSTVFYCFFAKTAMNFRRLPRRTTQS